MKYRAFDQKRDAAEPLVVEALQKCGCTVFRLSRPFDLLVWHPSMPGKCVALVEVKTGKAKLNANQERDAKRFPMTVIRNDQEAIAFVSDLRKGRAA